ncbi:Vitamin B12 import ATP-binding protein BtuD [bioreactor metagenome]|uniref:Vitamin B12 import ATP-binding protein BtuD n=1 Tax=bioreactor metagenome TaxID=1076179 RepID=A0A644X7N7_9ZZZZ
MLGRPVQSKQSVQGIFMPKHIKGFVMIDIAINDLNKYYGSNHVLKSISFEIYSGEKVGLLGKNGSGKSTLFKTIAGVEPFESGEISKASGKKIEMFAQIPTFGANDTAEDVLRTSFSEITETFEAMKEIEGNADPAVLARYGRLLERYELQGGYETEVRIDKICSGMNIGERMRRSLFEQLSGGEKARVNLARILLRECDILLLDEPTNHLDLASLQWLEDFLQDFPGTIVAVSHDRVFLDRVVTRIIEIDDGKAAFYSGNYSFYLEERERRYLTQAEKYKQQQRKIGQLEDAIKRQRVWAQSNPSNTGLAKRALAMEKRIEQMDKVEKPMTARKLSAGFDSGGHTAKETVLFDFVCKCYKEKVLMRDICLKILRNDRIAFVGANGSGKSTLLKMLMGEEGLDSGEIKIAANVKIGYMPQTITFDHANATILEVFRSKTSMSEEKSRSALAKFHFFAADVMKQVDTLSGGEKSRLKLCLMMQENINFLLLDEPTNHLDIASREWIENALSDFQGTMLFVSHDRYFLNKFAEKVWEIENGLITQYDCGFEEYLKAGRKNCDLGMAPKKSSSKNAGIITGNTVSVKAQSPSVEMLIIEAESELCKVNTAIEADLARADFSKMNSLHETKNQLTQRIDALYREWLESGDSL